MSVLAGEPTLADAQTVRARVLVTDTRVFEEHAVDLLTEVFGPTTLLVRYATEQDLFDALHHLSGTLTATLHAEPDEDIAELTRVLEDRAGRVLFEGWPTGVAVTWSQHHGGPWPAATSTFSSVGATSLRRFQRPIIYQDAPDAVLPPALREMNPLGIPRRVDGSYTV